jgi:GntR family transcriptional regulator
VSLPSLRSVPLADRTRAALVDAILDEAFPDGRLPAEPELARQLGVSRTTVRAALNDLHALGLIVRTPGAGTQLVSHTGVGVLGLSGLVTFERLLAARGHAVARRATIGLDEAVPAHVAAALRADGGEPVVQFSVVLLADGAPALASRARFRRRELARVGRSCSKGDAGGPELAALADPEHAADLPASVLDLAATDFAEPIDHAVAEIVPVVAPGDGHEGLDVAAGAPLLLLRETHYTAGSRPVATSDVVVDPAHLTLSVFRRAHGR